MTPYTARAGRLRLSCGNRAKIRRAHKAAHARRDLADFYGMAEEVGMELTLAVLADIRVYNTDPAQSVAGEFEEGR